MTQACVTDFAVRAKPETAAVSRFEIEERKTKCRGKKKTSRNETARSEPRKE
jgi:hypothetical protein